MATRLYILKPPGSSNTPAQGAQGAAPPVPAMPGQASPERAFSSPFASPVPSVAPAPAVPASDLIRPTAATGHVYPTTAMQGLSRDEKSELGQLAQAAWKAAVAADPEMLEVYLRNGVKKTAAQTHWRHLQCKLATRDHVAGQIDGISKATRAHYPDLEAHFRNLGGDSVGAFNAAMGTGDDGESLRADSKQAAWVLRQLMEEVKEAGLHPNYVKAIARNKFKGARVLNAKQIWQLIYTVRNRATAKERGGYHGSKGRNKSQRWRKPAPPADDKPF